MNLEYQMEQPNKYSIRLLVWEIVESKPCGFEPYLSQTNELKIDTWHFVARHLALLG